MHFFDVEEYLKNREYWELVRNVWIDSENIFANFSKWNEIWANDRSYKKFVMGPDDRRKFKNLPDQLTIYRGFQRLGKIHGMSWTLNKEKAEWFANRFRNGSVYLATAKIKKTDALAYFTDRNEDEIVVLSDNLKEISICEL